MNETQQKPRSLASFTSMFEEIRNNYGIDILKYDSFENFMIAFFSLLNKEELDSLPQELVFFE
ncbi:hypothetical protein [Lysinibacillus xylanilyticus]|uniref:hypothetical protein n=1 Tax=Lysinibacillus xylanilyticus TaxID=582475 RepID=UPI00083C9865|nr:hypothetical protein [Lysinibacillus xylanilyticus]